MSLSENQNKYFCLKASECIDRIKRDKYFLDIWETVSHKKPLVECSKDELLKPFQDFWEELPDDPSIRRGPFFEICDLAERYCFSVDEGDSEDFSF